MTEREQREGQSEARLPRAPGQSQDPAIKPQEGALADEELEQLAGGAGKIAMQDFHFVMRT